MALQIYTPTTEELARYERHGILTVRPDRFFCSVYSGYQVRTDSMYPRPKYVWIQKQHPETPTIILGSEKLKFQEGHHIPINAIEISNHESLERIIVDSQNSEKRLFEGRVTFQFSETESLKCAEPV